MDSLGGSLGANAGMGGGSSGGSNPYNFGALGSGIGDLLGAWNLSQQNYINPSGAAMPYLNQIGPMAQGYLNPYMQAGQGAMGQLQGQYGQLINNPGQRLNQIGQNFQQSPGFQFQVNQATNAANRAAAAGGMLGSPQEQQQLASNVNGLANQDYYNWLGNAQNMYSQGLQGLQGINQMGYGATNNLTDILASALQSQGSSAYAGAQGQNQFNQGQSGGIASLLSGGLSALGSFI